MKHATILAALAATLVLPGCGSDDAPAGGTSGSSGTGGAPDAAGGSAGTSGSGGTGGSGGSGGTQSPPVYSSCSSDGWCWALPDPQGNDLLAAWANSRTDVWVAGVHGTVLHHDGTRWSNARVPTTAALRGVWASGPSDVWIVGDDGVVLRFDGQSWTLPALALGADAGTLTTDLAAVSGSGPDDVWIAGAGGTLLHWDGARFSNPPSGTTRKLNAVWAAGAGDVWAVGDGGTVLHHDGVEWTAQTSGTTAALTSVHGTGPTDVWAVGGAILHYDGTDWSDERAGTQTTALWEVIAEAEDSVWLFGDGGGVWHRQADTWQKRSSGTESALRGVARLEPGKLLSVGELGTLVFWDGAGRALLTRGSARNRLAISGSAPNNVWAVGDEIVRFDGSTWSTVALDSRALFGVRVPNNMEAWAVGTGGAIARWEASSPQGSLIASGTSTWLRSLWTDETGSGWIVGALGSVFQLAGGSVTKAKGVTAADLVDVWGASPSAVWAVGETGTITHYDGTEWKRLGFVGTRAALRGVWGSSTTDVWVVGTERTILHFDGATWSAVTSADAGVDSLNDVWGSAANDVYAVGSGGTILHYDGNTWSAQQSGTFITLNGVWGSGANDVWVVGENGAILRRLR